MKLFKNAAIRVRTVRLPIGSITILLLFSTALASVAVAQSASSRDLFLKSDPLLLLCPGAQQKKVDNEFAFTGQPSGNFYCNPLVLDGMALDYNTFTLKSKGDLKLIKGEANSGRVTEILFYLRLRRNGTLIAHPCGNDVRFSKIEISIILEAAQKGDELIIEPVNKEDWPAKRIVKIGWDGC